MAILAGSIGLFGVLVAGVFVITAFRIDQGAERIEAQATAATGRLNELMDRHNQQMDSHDEQMAAYEVQMVSMREEFLSRLRSATEQVMLRTSALHEGRDAAPPRFCLR